MHYKSCKMLLPKKHIAGSLDLAVDRKHQVFGTVLGFVWKTTGKTRFLWMRKRTYLQLLDLWRSQNSDKYLQISSVQSNLWHDQTKFHIWKRLLLVTWVWLKIGNPKFPKVDHHMSHYVPLEPNFLTHVISQITRYGCVHVVYLRMAIWMKTNDGSNKLKWLGLGFP